MKTIFRLLIAVISMTLSCCSSIKIISDPKALEDCNYQECKQCEECKIIPKSGNVRDQRKGYYFDPIENKCKQIIYSSGGIPAPFKTMEDCRNCCCCKGYVNIQIPLK